MVDNIIFVKHGNKYNAEHVNRLFEQCFWYWPDAKYFCYTEDKKGIYAAVNIIPCFKKPKLKYWWNKLAMFSKDFPVKGKCLYFDLDMDIKRDPSEFITWDGLTIIRDYWKDDLYHAKTRSVREDRLHETCESWRLNAAPPLSRALRRPY